MENKHTFGPWQQDGSYIYGPDPLRFTICQMHYPGRGWQEEWAANESLIKAAPDMLAALKGLMAMIESGVLVRDTSSDHEPGWEMRQIPLVMVLKTSGESIAKAEGR